MNQPLPYFSLPFLQNNPPVRIKYAAQIARLLGNNYRNCSFSKPIHPASYAHKDAEPCPKTVQREKFGEIYFTPRLASKRQKILPLSYAART